MSNVINENKRSQTAVSKYETLNKSYINGEWVEGKSQRSIDITDPYDQSVITTVKPANVDQIKQAFEAAKKAQKDWAKSTSKQRKEVLQKVKEYIERNKEEIIKIITRESGGTALKANLEIIITLDELQEAQKMVNEVYVPKEYPSFIPGKVNKVYRLPLGVITSITPFNFPMNLGARTIFPAIALGNSVVHKPDLQTGITGGQIYAKAFEEAGLPAGVFNSILTDLEESGDEFLTNPNSPFISFTGSTAVGRHIGKVAGEHLKHLALELGGNSPVVVLSDADVDRAVKAAVYGKYVHNGQICMSTNRIIVQRDVYNEFVEKFVAQVKGLKVGDPKNPETNIGPVINERQADKIVGFIEQAKKDGLTVALEGKREGNVIHPYVFTDVPNNSTLAQTEIFGPVAQIIPAESDEEAIEFANATQYGLSSAIFTSDLERAEKLALEVEAGMTHVNDITVQAEANVAFGGVKASGLGRFGHEWIAEEMTITKWISVQKGARQYPF
ncbi:aldehyde dehydrogenase family protein [Jeotgalibacillus soli]|uniref:Aldehyde dehydrogenase n=1 Tax=Jeotgalibacillus soli TaxID=889306 RepID=A0A0C2R4U2_9BACL|nr:aldehyde dehydrogenase family protein [Jeotgalibacillus soli]KIL45295.1 aldehyde dehydrogenase [Jeotgalibacillus soli]